MPTPHGGITKASAEVMSKRRIVRARKKTRRAPSGGGSQANPFAALSGGTTATATTSVFAGLAKPKAPAWSPTAVKMSSAGYDEGFTLGVKTTTKNADAATGSSSKKSASFSFGPSSAPPGAASGQAGGAKPKPKPLAGFSFNVGAKADKIAAAAPKTSSSLASSLAGGGGGGGGFNFSAPREKSAVTKSPAFSFTAAKSPAATPLQSSLASSSGW